MPGKLTGRETAKGRIWRLLGRVALAAAISVAPAACGGGDESAVLSVSDVEQPEHFYEGKYLGKVVTVEGEVDKVKSQHALKISEGEYGDEKLLVLTSQPIDMLITAGKKVRVRGTAGQLREWSPSESLPYVERKLYQKSGTTAYVYDATVMPAASGR